MKFINKQNVYNFSNDTMDCSTELETIFGNLRIGL